ncbi:MAG TPA: hypothetical protein VE619_05505 [Nitrososphaeraceae archaeon]|nr:hypothetical protein [Nitrososphaeraceae archaeon]
MLEELKLIYAIPRIMLTGAHFDKLLRLLIKIHSFTMNSDGSIVSASNNNPIIR